MTNAERIARDLGFLVGQYERREITASTFCLKAEELTHATCEHCLYNPKDKEALFCKTSETCDEGFRRWLAAEVDT